MALSTMFEWKISNGSRLRSGFERVKPKSVGFLGLRNGQIIQERILEGTEGSMRMSRYLF